MPFKDMNFCHSASNNRNRTKLAVFTYKGQPNEWLKPGFFDSKATELNLNDIILCYDESQTESTDPKIHVVQVISKTTDTIQVRAIEFFSKALYKVTHDDSLTGDGTVTNPLSVVTDDFVRKSDTDNQKVDGSFTVTEEFSIHNQNGDNMYVLAVSGNMITEITDSVYYVGNRSFENLPFTDDHRSFQSIQNYQLVTKAAVASELNKLDAKINTAATSGNLIGSYWFGKTDANFTVPNPTIANQNYFDFTNNTPYTADADLSGWTAGTPITAPSVVSQIQITSKFWNIPEQEGQQGGTAYWSPTQQDWSYAPKIISFDSPNFTGIPTTPALSSDSPANQVINKEDAQDVAASASLTNNNYQKVINQILTATTAVSFAGNNNQIAILDNVTTPVESATITMAFPTATATDCYTFELRIKVGETLPEITWSNNIKWLIDTEQRPQEINATNIFVFQIIGSDIVGNYAGAY